ncbi:Ribosomal RNA processing protein 1-like protein B [Camelus dromedarius]|uniref:Ribosomal RNA processing protein 1-like protein B n=1 Tax=Camelus dromedarius TaxID=9838 RepID=A0A5N4E2Y5_CAMDR|nr:Ribosomal RNA processing protein 1-like protein B [Camelus dromedarius]
MQPAETQLAERMASHGKGIRDQAVKKLLQYISRKMQRETGGGSSERYVPTHLFVQASWQTTSREWKKIHRLHLDRYCIPIRLVLNQSSEVMK